MEIRYKCRLCGNTFSESGGGYESCKLAIQIAIGSLPATDWRGKIGIPPDEKILHYCDENQIGVADLIGAY